MRPTGRLHVGHYFSVIKPGRAGAEVLIANYHAPEEKNLADIVAVLSKFGVQTIRLQKEVFNADLFFHLLTLAQFGDLSRMTQFKSADPETRTAQLLTYPVLMAHDVAGYDEVLVGEDQEQHLEFAKKLLKKYNKRTGSNLRIPRMNIVGGRILDLKDSTAKMSKSSPDGCLFLDDSRDELRRKLRKASVDEAGRKNLELLFREFCGPDVPEGNEQLKTDLAEGMANVFA